MDVDIRERTRDAVRAELATRLFEVFADRGFGSITVDEAAREVGISRATFFRYFRGKEDAVIVAIESGRPDYVGAIAAAALPRDASPWALVRAAVEPFVVAAEQDPGRQRARVAVVQQAPAVAMRLTERRISQTARLSDALLPHVADGLSARVLAATGMAAYDVAWREWSGAPDLPFRATFDAVFDRLANPRGVAAPQDGTNA